MTLLAAFALLARPATYTATARIEADPQLLPMLQSAALFSRLSSELQDAPEYQRYRSSDPDAASLDAEL